MNHENILQIAQKHGDLAFKQGYMAAKNDISIEEAHKMNEAFERIIKFQELAKALEEINN